MIGRCVPRKKVSNCFRIAQHHHSGTQTGGYLVNRPIRLFPLLVHGAEVKCVEKILCYTKNEALAGGSFEPGSFDTVYVQVRQDGQNDPGCGNDVDQIIAQVERAGDTVHCDGILWGMAEGRIGLYRIEKWN